MRFFSSDKRRHSRPNSNRKLEPQIHHERRVRSGSGAEQQQGHAYHHPHYPFAGFPFQRPASGAGSEYSGLRSACRGVTGPGTAGTMNDFVAGSLSGSGMDVLSCEVRARGGLDWVDATPGRGVDCGLGAA